MRFKLFFCLILFVGTSLLVPAQDPAATSKSGKRLVIEPNPLVVKVGDTRQVHIKAFNEAGQELQNGKFSFITLRSSGVVPSSGALADTLGNISGMSVGTYNLAVFWLNPDGAFFRDYLQVKVENWAPAKISIKDLPPKAMEGSVISLDFEVLDEKGVAIVAAAPKVISSNSQVATVDAFHQLRLLKPGKTRISASIGKAASTYSLTVIPTKVSNITLNASHDQARTGDVVYFEAKTYEQNKEIEVPVNFSISSASAQSMGSPGAMIRGDGAFVAERPGFYTVNAIAGGRTASYSINVVERNVQQDIEVTGRGTVTNKHTTDFWLWEGVDGRDYAVTGTFSADGMAYFWDITDPVNIQRIDSIQVDARNVNDVKISDDGKICVISREGASSRKNGIVILDVANPRNVEILSQYNDRLTGGVHNLFIYQEHVYALSNGQHYEIINISDPTQPHRVGRFEIDNPARAIHDVWVEDGIAYSSNWNDGVIMVDIGNGVAGGSPANPVEISRTKVTGDANHTTFPFRSPSANKFYVIAGDEIFPLQWLSKGLTETLQPRGYIHFIDWTDKDNPVEVASYQVPEAGAHNYWVEDETLYIGYYTGGVRVVDISGELMGDLYQQGREIGYFVPRDPQGKVPNMAMTWGARPYKGHVFFTDMNTGLWAVKVRPKQPQDVPVTIQD